jgi:hypothetical protein
MVAVVARSEAAAALAGLAKLAALSVVPRGGEPAEAGEHIRRVALPPPPALFGDPKRFFLLLRRCIRVLANFWRAKPMEMEMSARSAQKKPHETEAVTLSGSSGWLHMNSGMPVVHLLVLHVPGKESRRGSAFGQHPVELVRLMNADTFSHTGQPFCNCLSSALSCLTHVAPGGLGGNGK